MSEQFQHGRPIVEVDEPIMRESLTARSAWLVVIPVVWTLKFGIAAGLLLCAALCFMAHGVVVIGQRIGGLSQ